MPRSSQKSGSARKRNKPRRFKLDSTAPYSDKTKDDGARNENIMGLLGENERQVAIEELQSSSFYRAEEKRLKDLIYSKDRTELAFIMTLYLLQGIPIGLAFGSVPLLLGPKLTPSQLGIFSLATYTCSLKLLWSPLIDSVFNPAMGRRKSWIVPLQFMIGSIMLWMSSHIQSLMDGGPHVGKLAVGFASLAILTETHGIAVDGWALTLFSEDNLSYASVARMTGLSTGYFLSSTVFLALSNVDFSNKYLRTVPSNVPVLSLDAYLEFWGFACVAAALGLLMFKKEYPVDLDEPYLNPEIVCRIVWDICKLKHVQSLFIIHTIASIGFQISNTFTSIKLTEKGLSQGQHSFLTLINLSAQIVGGWYAVSWSRGSRPLHTWLWAYWTRLGIAIVGMGLIYTSSSTGLMPSSYFWSAVVFMGLNSFTSAVQSISVATFHTRIADPLIGGTYVKLLGAVSNFGGAWPQFFMCKGIHVFNEGAGRLQQEYHFLQKATECVPGHGKGVCTKLGSTSMTELGGHHTASWMSIGLGALILVTYIAPALNYLQGLDIFHWGVPRVWVLFVITFKCEREKKGWKGKRRT